MQTYSLCGGSFIITVRIVDGHRKNGLQTNYNTTNASYYLQPLTITTLHYKLYKL